MYSILKPIRQSALLPFVPIEKSGPWRTKRKAGFTLIELLVVISIIAMLMSIMLPGLNNALEMGRRVVCLSNMRQLGIAWTTYTYDNEDTLCSPDTDFNNKLLSSDGLDHHWVADGSDNGSNPIGGTIQAIKNGVLYSYISEVAQMYKCKSDSTELLRSYSISNTMGGYHGGTMTTPYHSLSGIRNQSNKLVFVDADSIAPDGDVKWINGSFWPISDINPEIATWAIPENNNITARHGDGTNMAFADTHADYRKWREYQTIEIAKWNSYYYNWGNGSRDLEFLCEIMKGPND